MSSPTDGGRRSGHLWIAVAIAVPVIAAGYFSFRSAEPPSTRDTAAAVSGEANIDIYAYDLLTGTDIRLTNHARPDADPVWSPDGTKIAFARFTESDLHD